MRWPGAWTDPALLDRVKGAGLDTLLVDNSDEFEPVRARAEQMGLRVEHPHVPPAGVRIVKGEWPGVRRSRNGADATAGPTGAPWVDSNGWVVRLTGALHPDCAAWIEGAPPQEARPSGYLTAIADSAAYGGRWIVALDNALAEGIVRGNANATATWKTIGQAALFFAGRRAWDDYTPAAGIGVISDFSGENEFFSHELLNLFARAGQHYLVLPKAAATASSLRGLRAAVYADAQPPSVELRKEVAAFAAAGGILIATPAWGAASKGGHILPADDPYQFTSAAVVLVSHRYDLVRYWNAGAAGSYYAVSPDRKQAVVHLLFYADRGPDIASVRIAGPYRKVKASMVNAAEIPGVRTEAQKDAVEVYLPQVSQHVALELTV
jgi:hypothetical protein